MVKLLSAYPSVSVDVTLLHEFVHVTVDGLLTHGISVSESKFCHQLFNFIFLQVFSAVGIVLVIDLVDVFFKRSLVNWTFGSGFTACALGRTRPRLFETGRLSLITLGTRRYTTHFIKYYCREIKLYFWVINIKLSNIHFLLSFSLFILLTTHTKKVFIHSNMLKDQKQTEWYKS